MDISKTSTRVIRSVNFQNKLEQSKKRAIRKERIEKRKARAKGDELEIVPADEAVGDMPQQAKGKDDGKMTKKRKRTERRKHEMSNKIWKHFDRKSADANRFFTEYYRKQLCMKDDKEWNKFISIMSSNLQVTFRINRGRYPSIADSLDERLKTEFRFSGSFVRIGAGEILSSEQVVNPAGWIRDVWQLGTDRMGFSKATALGPLYETVNREANLGHIARQGIASMVPAIVLAPSSSDMVLDMCAAPGSKSEQLLQMIGSSGDGLVVTNDSDPKRLQSVERRFRNFGYRNHVVTCSRGEDLYQHLGGHVFDGIICDVPCTGDGTIRKYPYLWRRWRAKKGVLLHTLQLQIALSAASLLKVGGRMVYYTCSINPIEDEAVVASIIEASKGALKLVKIDLAQFKVRQGIHEWSADLELMKKDGLLEEDEDDDFIKKKAKGKKAKAEERIEILPTMCPPKNANMMNLDRCIRILPQDNDTGGFFVALLEKVKPWELATKKTNTDEQKISASKSKTILRKMGFNPRLASELSLPELQFLPISDKVAESIESYTGIHTSTSQHDDGLVRLKKLDNGEVSVTCVSQKVSDMLDSDWAREGKVPILSAGVTVATAKCVFERKSQEITDVSPFILNAPGALELVDVADDMDEIGAFADRGSFFALLHLAREAFQVDQDEENDDDDGQDEPSKTKKQTENLPEVSLEECLELLDEDDENDLPARLQELKIGHSLVILLPQADLDELRQETQKREETQQKTQQVTNKRMSKAERKRLKKALKGKQPAGKGPGKEQGEIKKERVDMFTKTEAPKFAMSLVVRKVSPHALQILTGHELVVSFGQALQVLLKDEATYSDEGEEEEN
mmetsp:Transcript_2611/g.5528  ORF Transcript_2611/g.5528 Transcript_2611/m.5528 type:complete len:853 (-) Transcript_2611:38-2596(-)